MSLTTKLEPYTNSQRLFHIDYVLKTWKKSKKIIISKFTASYVYEFYKTIHTMQHFKIKKNTQWKSGNYRTTLNNFQVFCCQSFTLFSKATTVPFIFKYFPVAFSFTYKSIHTHLSRLGIRDKRDKFNQHWGSKAHEC